MSHTGRLYFLIKKAFAEGHTVSSYHPSTPCSVGYNEFSEQLRLLGQLCSERNSFLFFSSHLNPPNRGDIMKILHSTSATSLFTVVSVCACAGEQEWSAWTPYRGQDTNSHLHVPELKVVKYNFPKRPVSSLKACLLPKMLLFMINYYLHP